MHCYCFSEFTKDLTALEKDLTKQVNAYDKQIQKKQQLVERSLQKASTETQNMSATTGYNFEHYSVTSISDWKIPLYHVSNSAVAVTKDYPIFIMSEPGVNAEAIVSASNWIPKLTDLAFKFDDILGLFYGRVNCLGFLDLCIEVDLVEIGGYAVVSGDLVEDDTRLIELTFAVVVLR